MHDSTLRKLSRLTAGYGKPKAELSPKLASSPPSKNHQKPRSNFSNLVGSPKCLDEMKRRDVMKMIEDAERRYPHQPQLQQFAYRYISTACVVHACAFVVKRPAHKFIGRACTIR